MRDAARGIVAGVVALALRGAIATRAGWIAVALPRPHGPGAWLICRASGLLAYVALGADVIAGLLVSTRRAERLVPRAQLLELHRWLAPLALAAVLAHVVVLLADDYVRFDLVDLAVPFAAGRWPVALGTLGAYLVLVVHLSFGLRRRIGVATWRKLHYLSFVAFVLVTVHAIAAGTDRASVWFAASYLAISAAVVALVVVRITRAAGRRR